MVLTVRGTHGVAVKQPLWADGAGNPGNGARRVDADGMAPEFRRDEGEGGSGTRARGEERTGSGRGGSE